MSPEINLDFSDVPPMDIEEGWHAFRVVMAEPRVASTGTRMLTIQASIQGGSQDGRSVFRNLMLEGDGLVITRAVLVRLGLMDKDDEGLNIDTEDLIGLEFDGYVENQDYQGEPRPQIQRFRQPTGETIEDLQGV